MFLWFLLVFSFESVFASPISNSLSAKSSSSKAGAGNCYMSFADNAKPFDKEVLVIGSGAFGLSFAQAISGNFKTIRVFTRNIKSSHQILTQQKSALLPGIKLSSNIKPIMELEFFLNQAPQIIVLALPVLEIPSFVNKHSRIFSALIKKQPKMAIISLSKGFYFKKGQIQFIQDLLLEGWPHFNPNNFYLISGPSFALELAQGEKTLVHLAGQDKIKTQQIKKMFMTNTLDLELSEDLKGVAFAGAIKNVMAIVGGLAKGLNLSHNSKASLILRGTKELIKIGQELGASQESFLGPAYLGDLILSLEKESRNTRFGLALGRGQSLSVFFKQNPNINIEGLNTIKSLKNYLKDREGFEFIRTLYKIVYEGQEPQSLLSVAWPTL